MMNPLRDPHVSEKASPAYNFIEHPNIKLDRIKQYSNYAKLYAAPVFIGIPTKSTSNFHSREAGKHHQTREKGYESFSLRQEQEQAESDATRECSP
jgi:hypothetical protein